MLIKDAPEGSVFINVQAQTCSDFCYQKRGNEWSHPNGTLHDVLSAFMGLVHEGELNHKSVTMLKIYIEAIEKRKPVVFIASGAPETLLDFNFNV